MLVTGSSTTVITTSGTTADASRVNARRAGYAAAPNFGRQRSRYSTASSVLRLIDRQSTFPAKSGSSSSR